jgi:hypothetical protein
VSGCGTRGAYRVAGPEWGAICYPPPVQEPRIPVWVGGTWPTAARPFERAARWDGVIPMRTDGTWAVEDTVGVATRMAALRGDGGPFEVAVPVESRGDGGGRADLQAEHAAAGATWWIEPVHPWREDLPGDRPWSEAARVRIDAGP